jgi:RNA polymerase sigma-70 factor (sigma-E family)
VTTIFRSGVVDVAKEAGVDDFDEYVTAAWPRLLRSAWLLTADWHKAEDLVQTVLARVYSRWHRLRDHNPDAYLRMAMTSTYLTWWRRKWRGETAWARLPDTAAPDSYENADLRISLAGALTRLPPRQRAVLMLRYHADLTEAETAHALGISVGTVKSHTARALAALRADPTVASRAEALRGTIK